VDFDTGDTLRLDDIQFQLTPASVPEPPIALLLLTGMWGLWRNGRPRPGRGKAVRSKRSHISSPGRLWL